MHEGDREAVEQGAAWSAAAFGGAAGAAAPDADPDAGVRARIALNALEHVCPERGNVLVRGSVRPTRLPAVAARLAAAGVGVIGGFAASGAVFARLDLGAEGGRARLAAVTRAIEEAGGTWRVQGAWRPEDGPTDVPWGGVDTPWALYARLKKVFDPEGVLGPAVYARRLAAAGATSGAATDVAAGGAR
jgi:hypothetical protein